MTDIKHLSEPINFDKWTERASSAGKLNTNPAGKTNMQRYIDCLADIKELEEKAKIKPLIASQLQKLNDYKENLVVLKSRKDLIELSETTKSHLRGVYWAERTGLKPNFFSKYTENGKMAEEEAIRLISELDDPDLFEMGSPIYEKCALPRQFNNHFQGECDIKKSPTIQDTKVCWDIFTYFPHVNELTLTKDGKTKYEWSEKDKAWILPENNIENDDYECQGIVYMELYGEVEFWLRYCLVDMPAELLESEYKKIAWALGSKESDAYIKSCEEFKAKHTFSHLPLSLRVCTFKIKRSLDKYLDLCKRVELSRVYLNWYSEEMFYFENPQKRIRISNEEKIAESIAIWREQKEIFHNAVNDIVENIEEEKQRGMTINGLDSSAAELIAGSENVFEESYENIRIANIEKNIIEELKSISSTERLKEYHNNLIETGVLFNNKEYISINQLFRNKEIELSEFSVEVEIVDEQGLVNEFISEIENSKPIDEEKLFPDVLDDINPENIVEEIPEPSEEVQNKLDEKIQEMIEGEDKFLSQIQSILTVDDAVAFYMENSDLIDDTKYESYFMAKKEALSNSPVNSPKVKATPKVKASAPQQEQTPIVKKIEEEVYTGNETYDISDGVNILKAGIGFEEGKLFIISYLENKFKEWNEPNSHRSNITAFYVANKKMMERDMVFKEKISNMSKEEYKRLIEAGRKAVLDSAKM